MHLPFRVVETFAAFALFVGCGLARASDQTPPTNSSRPAELQRGTPEPPRTLSPRGLANVTAFARLLGYVRHFHPSDEAAAADWEDFAITGLRTVEGAASADELARTLGEIFAPIAPSVRIHPVGTAPIALVRPAGSVRLTTWEHIGLGTDATSKSIYQSKRTTRAFSVTSAPPAELLLPFVAELGDGLACSVPLALWTDETGALPGPPPAGSGRPAKSKTTRPAANPGDRATRLAAVVLAWNVLQHSYPYFEIAGTDWPRELPTALKRAATDADGIAFLGTLRRLIAALHDGHGRVTFADEHRAAWPAVRAEWVEDRLTVTFAADRVRQLGLSPGDAIVSLDGRPLAELAAEAEAEISGATPQWIGFRKSEYLFRGAPRSSLTIGYEPFAHPGEHRTAVVSRESGESQVPNRAGRAVREVEPGILYLDLSRLSTDEYVAALPQLERARGLVFDLRGYPAKLTPFEFFAHLTRAPLTSAQWHRPQITRPDRQAMGFVRGGEWRIAPKSPYLAAQRAFITDGRAISYAESCLGIVEHYKLGAIVGGPTAGTNGNINRLSLPGGYTIVWTGMKVLKHDGSRHHGVGILPTIPCRPTRAGIAAGRDELLERAIRAVKEK